MSLMSTILADLVGLECLPEATGVLLLAIGCSLLVSMPLAGKYAQYVDLSVLHYLCA